MKVLAFADVHGSKKDLDKLEKVVKKEKPEVIVCAGDLSNFEEDFENLVKKIDFGVPVLIIPGNHESASTLKELDNKFDYMINLHQGVFEKDNVLFLGSGRGGFEFGDDEFSRVANFFKREIEKFKGKTVLVTHAPPRNTNLDALFTGEHVGSRSIQKFIKDIQPTFAVSGHIHDSEGKIDKIGKTICMNLGPHGKVLDI